MEEQKIESPIEEKKVKKVVSNNMDTSDGPMKLYLLTYEAVGKFKSVRRAIRRGHVSMQGYIVPKRPFGNTKSATNVLKRRIYEQLKSGQR